MDNTRFASAHSPGNAPKMVVEVPTTLSYMMQKNISWVNLNLGKGALVKQLLLS